MSQSLQLTVMYFRAYLRDRTAIFFSLVVPLMLLLIFGSLNLGAFGKVSLAIDDQAGTLASQQFVAALEKIDTLSIKRESADTALAKLKRTELDMLVVVPKDFAIAPTRAGQQVPTLTIYGNASRPQQTSVGESIINEVVTRLSYAVNQTAPVLSLKVEDVQGVRLRYVDFHDRDDVTVLAYKMAAAFAKATPGPFIELGVPTLGLMFSQAMRGPRKTVERHQRRVKGPNATMMSVRLATQEAFESYAKYWIESFRLPSLSTAEVRKGFTIDGWEHVRGGLDSGNGVLLSLPHLGNWEWAGRWLADQNIPMTVVVEPVNPPELFEWFRDLRTDFGMTVLPLGPDVASKVLGALKRNEVVCLMSDRDLTGDGQKVRFFGEQTTMPAGPATLAIRTGAPLIPAAAYMGRRGTHHAIVRPPIDTARGTDGLRADVARVTQTLADELEFLIRQAPEQWHLFQPNWPSDPGYRF